MSIETRLANVAAGSLYLNIETSGSAIFADLLDMSSLTYDYDLKTSEDVATLGAITGALSVQIDDRLSNGGSAYDVLESIIGDYSASQNLFVAPSSNANLYYDDKTSPGNYVKFPFTVYFTGVKTNEKTNVTSIELRPKLLPFGATAAQVEENINTGVYNYNGSAINISNRPSAGDYIESALSYLIPSGGTLIFETGSAGTYLPNIMTKRSDIPTVFAPFAERGVGVFVNPEALVAYSASAVVSKLAGLEGCIYGAGFDTSFYMPRTTNTYNVTLTEDAVTALSFEQIDEAISEVNLSVSNSPETSILLNPGATFGNYHVLSNVNYTVPAWQFGSQSVKIDWRGEAQKIINTVFIDLSTARVAGLGQFETSSTLNTNAITEATKSTTNVINAQFITQNILETASKQYLAAQGVQRLSNGDLRPTLKISTEVIGVKTLKPHQVFKFDTSVPARYQGKHFRPSSLEYDFKKDLVRVTAYEI